MGKSPSRLIWFPTLTRLAPRLLADHLMECVETHAYHTYDDFLKNFGEKLKTKPAPAVAVKYYTEGELYMFGEFNNGLVCSLQWCGLLTSVLRLDRNVGRLCTMRAAGSFEWKRCPISSVLVVLRLSSRDVSRWFRMLESESHQLKSVHDISFATSFTFE